MFFLWKPTYKIPVKEAVRNMIFHFCDLEFEFCILAGLFVYSKKAKIVVPFYKVSFSVADPDVYPGSEFFHPGSRVKKTPDPRSKRRRNPIPDPDRNKKFKYF
jgi:hypothetical protein